MSQMDASLLEFYEKKIQRLELENLQLQEELLDKPTDDYKLKYQLLLDKMAEESHLRESKRTQEITNQEHSLEQINTKWEAVLQDKTNELMATITALQREIKPLSSKNTELELKLVKLQRELDEGNSEVLQVKMDGIKKENERLRREIKEAYEHCENKIASSSQEVEERVQEVKER